MSGPSRWRNRALIERNRPLHTVPSMSETPRPYLLAWRLDGRRVVVVGGGNIGTAKVETLLGTGASIVVFDPTPSERALDLARQGKVTVVERRVRPTDLLRTALVVAATGDSKTNRRIRRWAKPLGVVVNAVDDRDNCDVTVPAVIHRGPATVAITTGGTTPAGARFLREELTDAIEAALPADADVVLEHARCARDELKRSGRYRYDYAAWRQMYFEPAIDAVRHGRTGAVAEVRRRFEAEFTSATTPLRSGSVTLVGAGPGGADLITVRGVEALKRADVVVYDRLADPELVDLAPPAAERIPVGKGKGFGTSQEEINRLLVHKSSEGSHVVRLKGGDPFVFGRGGEEVDACRAADVPVTVVPGVSSALAGPCLAGVPVTDRRAASSFTVVTGHLAGRNQHDLQALGATDSTLVVLMASSTADSVAVEFCRGGRAADEPVVFVHAAGTDRQAVHRTDLASVMQDGCPFPAPSVMVVGPVAAMSDASDLAVSLAATA